MKLERKEERKINEKTNETLTKKKQEISLSAARVTVCTTELKSNKKNEKREKQSINKSKKVTSAPRATDPYGRTEDLKSKKKKVRKKARKTNKT